MAVVSKIIDDRINNSTIDLKVQKSDILCWESYDHDPNIALHLMQIYG